MRRGPVIQCSTHCAGNKLNWVRSAKGRCLDCLGLSPVNHGRKRRFTLLQRRVGPSRADGTLKQTAISPLDLELPVQDLTIAESPRARVHRRPLMWYGRYNCSWLQFDRVLP